MTIIVLAAKYVVLMLDLVTGANSSLTLQKLPLSSLEYNDVFVDNNGDLLAIVQDSK